MTFCVQTQPFGKQRARTFYDKRSGKMRSITPEKTRSFEDLVRWSYAAAGGQYLGSAQVSVHITGFYAIPKSFTKRQRKEALEDRIRPATKPDADNCAKAILDALNGVCYLDDRQVVSLHVEKHYSPDNSFTRVSIEPLEPCAQGE